MRIRKHAKISPLLYASTSLKPGTVFQTHVCQLNQSPWDVITFPPPDPSELPPPPPFLVDKDYTYWTNGTSDDRIGADESSPASSEKWDGVAFDNGGTGTEKQDKQLRSKKEGEEYQICSYKTDGKGGQCRRKAKKGQSFCQHHSSQVQISTKVAQPAAKQSENRRQARARKPASSSNPYEFYYYSGFGPRWGKKRGLPPAAIKEEEPYTSTESSSDTSTKTDTNNIIEVADEGPIFLEPNVKYSSLSSDQIEKEGLDYVEDDDEDEDNNGKTVRKRARKPIKARSLKSLM